MHGEGKVWLVSFGHLVKGSNVRKKKADQKCHPNWFLQEKRWHTERLAAWATRYMTDQLIFLLKCIHCSLVHPSSTNRAAALTSLPHGKMTLQDARVP